MDLPQGNLKSDPRLRRGILSPIGKPRCFPQVPRSPHVPSPLGRRPPEALSRKVREAKTDRLRTRDSNHGFGVQATRVPHLTAQSAAAEEAYAIAGPPAATLSLRGPHGSQRAMSQHQQHMATPPSHHRMAASATAMPSKGWVLV